VEYYKENKIEDIMFMCIMFKEKTPDEMEDEVLEGKQKSRSAELPFNEQDFRKSQKKYSALSFLGFSTNRRAMGNFMLNITLFETVLTGRQELLKPDDLSNFVEWTPEDFK